MLASQGRLLHIVTSGGVFLCKLFLIHSCNISDFCNMKFVVCCGCYDHVIVIIHEGEIL